MSKMYPPERLTIDYQTYKMFEWFCHLLADGYVISEVKDNEHGFLIVSMKKELEDVCNN